MGRRVRLRWGDRDGIKIVLVVVSVVVDHKTQGFEVGIFEVEEDLLK